MSNKKFDKALFTKYDPPARKAVTDWLKMKWDMDAKPNPDEYGTDLILYRDGRKIGYAEVEVRQWNPCPFDTVRVHSRKKKMLDIPNTLFFALTNDMKHAYWIKAEKVLEHPLVLEPNKHSNTEYFYDVPKSQYKYVDLTEPF